MTPRGFVMLRASGRNIPRVVCERCGELIDDLGMAGVVFQRQDAFERVLQDIRAEEKRAPAKPPASRPAKTVYERVQGGLDRGEDFQV